MVTLKVFFAGTKMKRSFKQYLHVLVFSGSLVSILDLSFFFFH